MAAVLEQNDTAAKNGSAVDEQIAQATSRIRVHDITFGGLVLLALVLVYTTTMIVLDRYLVLPEWVRQVALFGFLASIAGTAYLTLVSPLRKRINPLYAAKQVERTIEDAKNSVTGYIDAQQKGTMNATVKAALASRAAKSVAEADVNKAVDHRSLIYLGGVAVVFLLALVVLFFVFRPAQFGSLLGRTFVPFSSTVIASRTQLTIMKPDPVEPTITTGQSITVAVNVGGKVPNPDSPEKVRLLIRHNQADPNYDELPMVRGETARDWELRVPDYLVQNGFWYKVAAGDAVTPEYKVTVRSLPMFTDFQTTYEYPKYLRRKPDTANDPVIRTYRGTTVTLVARTNREVRDGLMVIEPSNTRVAGTAVPGKPDSLQFVFKIAEAGKYKLTFNAANAERSADAFQSTIRIETDAAPQVVITKPEEEDPTVQPTNGQLKVDGKIGDDFGIATVTLKMKIVEPVEIPLPDVPYMNGKTTSFLREKDNTWPTDLDYKGSVDLALLKKNAAGLDLVLTPDMVIEYWLEATDNCTEPKPNVGRSQPKRLNLTAPKVAEMEKKNLDQDKDNRKNEEKKHDDKQQKKLDNENREPKKGGKQDKDGADGNPKTGDQNPDPKPGNKGADKSDNPPKKEDAKNPNDPPMKGDMGMGDKGMPMPMGPNDPTTPKGGPDMPPNDPNGMKPEAPPPSTPDQKKLDESAQDLKKELDKQNQDGGAGKPNTAPPDSDRKDPGQAKPEPMDGKGNPADTKPEPKQPNPADPMGKPDAGEGKPQGDVKQPEAPSAPKPDEKKGEPMAGQKGGEPSENRDKPGGGGAAGTDKEQPKNPPPAPKDPNQKQDPNSGSEAKPATPKKDGEPGGMPNSTEKKDPAADAGSKAKPSPETKRGDDKPQPKEPPATDKPEGNPEAGTAKPDKAPPAGDTKPMPMGDPMAKGMDSEPKPGDGANDMMKPNGTGAAEAKPDEKKNPPMGGGKPVEKGGERPQPNNDKSNAAGGGAGAPIPKRKLDEKERKELEQAAKDLTDPDPKKKQDARDKLDKAFGEENRKEIEQIANDLKSPDKDKREAAEQKIKDAMKKADGKADGKDPEKKGDAPKLDEKQIKELTDAVKDLQSADPDKKKQAQDKLDKAIGEDKRKEIEQLAKDLKSDDKDKKAAAEKKLDDLKKEMDKLAKQDGKKGGKEDPKAKELTPEEIAELAKKAKDLQSMDENTRKQAQKDLDEKIGEENRKKLEEKLKNQKPGDPEQEKKTKEQLEQMAKEMQKKLDDEWKMGPGSSPAAKGPMEEDKKNRLKTAELMLEEFEKNRYNKALQAKQGWTQDEMNKFLDGWQKRVADSRPQKPRRMRKSCRQTRLVAPRKRNSMQSVPSPTSSANSNRPRRPMRG